MSDYEGPAYAAPSSVRNLRALPRFGHASDVTALLSPDPDAQADYAAGLVCLFAFLLIFFVLWTVAILVFRAMGPGNAGFLSGHRFVVREDEHDIEKMRRRHGRVRAAFLAAAALLMAFDFLFVAAGLTNVNNAATTVGISLDTTEQLARNAERIAYNLEIVGRKSIEIRDEAVEELDNICPNNPDIGDLVGIDITGIAQQAGSDLTLLADFISDGLEALNENLSLVRGFTDSASDAVASIQFWGWEMKLLVAGLFVLPAFLAVGVGLVMLDVNVVPYQRALTYVFMPLFSVTIAACYVVCCLILPVAAAAADVCSGGGEVRGGPDDTILTVYRNLRGADDGLALQFVGYYTQRCDPSYYPFGFLGSYLEDLDAAKDSTGEAYTAMVDNQALLEQQCGRPYGDVLGIVDDMADNLRFLEDQVDNALDLVKCENINRLYVNTVHEAGCTYSVNAMAWIFASSLVISVCGLVMIMLRSAYYTTEYLDAGGAWDAPDGDKTAPTKSESGSWEASGAGPVDARKADRERGARREMRSPPPPPAITPESIKVSQVNENEIELDAATDSVTFNRAVEMGRAKAARAHQSDCESDGEYF